MRTIKITDDITYYIDTHVFVHNGTGYPIAPDIVLTLDFDDLSDRMYSVTKTWLGIDNYVRMKEFISNVETLYT
jgi:hypothetical protein